MKRVTRKNRRSRRKTRKQKGGMGDGFKNRRTIRNGPLVNDYLSVDDLPVLRRV